MNRVTTPAHPKSRPRSAPTTEAADGDRTSLPSYRLGGLLGRGGMGEVVLADDLEIGRQVAIKRLRPELSSDAMVGRFLREARIQALLDHPAIVPVHEVGRDAAGRPYFTMKRLSGTTLSEAIESGRATQQSMLRAFAEVCLAIGFAHARGILHRDLKPANIMLGEYGEVYVIDWGLARAFSTGDSSTESDVPASRDSFDHETQLGAVMGTPGYMSPEQTRGETVGPATDVYALGTILFEILTRRKLDGDAVPDALSVHARSPDRSIPPELDAICVVALSHDPAARPPAREIGERVQRYLDGDRDLERRRALAAELLTKSQVDLASGDPARRGSALKTASRALALDPESEVAGALVAKIMIEPPPVMPPELATRLRAIDLQQTRVQGKRDGLSLGVYFVFLPLLLAMGMDWSQGVALYVFVVLAIAISLARSQWPTIPVVLGLAANAAMLIALSRLTSPLFLIPTQIVGSAILFLMFSELLYRPVLVIGTSLATFFVPIVLETTGVWEATWQITGDRLIASPSISLGGTAGHVFVIGVTVVAAVAFPMLVRALAIAQRDGRRQLEFQAWHLQHLVPTTTLVSSRNL